MPSSLSSSCPKRPLTPVKCLHEASSTLVVEYLTIPANMTRRGVGWGSCSGIAECEWKRMLDFQRESVGRVVLYSGCC